MKLLLIVALVAVTLVAFSSQSVPHTSVAASSALELVGQARENYDIRLDASDEATAKLLEFRNAKRDHQIQPIDRSSTRFKLEFNDTIGAAETISPQVLDEPLANADAATRARTLEKFIVANHSIFGVRSLAQLKKTADYTNPDGNLSFVRYEQWIGGIPVFGAEVKAGFSKRNEMFRIVNSLAPNVEAANAAIEFGDAAVAVSRAASRIGVGISPGDLTRNESSKAGIEEFTSSAFTDRVTVERFYFPVGNGMLRPSWRVLLWTQESSYYVVVDVDGTMLWRKNLTEHQTIPSTYNVYGNSTSLMKTADNPSPFTPGCLTPIDCAQPLAIPRTDFTLIGNEAPYTFNNLGWIPDTGLPVRTPADPNITDGNNVESGIDRVTPQGVDENGWARTTGMPARVFSYTYNPAPGNPPPGEEPLGGAGTPSQFQQGAATHGFYLINRWHDEMYRFGFTEQAGNFQHFNFGRGGLEGDRVSLEVQDSSGFNGSTFSIVADGNRTRIQAFIWNNPTPDRDGALDSQIITHEMTHGLSHRLIGNATGLFSNMSAGMGEGWGDFYAFALLSEPSDNPLGTHALAGYTTYQLGGMTSNYYHGIRRFPVATLASRGPNGLPHNPLTFRYLNSNCDTFIGTTSTNPSSAYPRNPVVANSSTCDQIHNMGEVWAVALWEVRDQLIQRRGAAEGNRRAIQYITDGMKLSPLNPTLIQMRDSILTAVAATNPADLPAVWRGFATRGMGSGAAVINAGTGNNNTVVTESFLMPPQFRRPARADFDGDARTDISVFRPSDRVWYLNRSTTGFAAVGWGLSTDVPIPDDYDGDGKHDVTVFRATADGTMPDFYVLRSTDFAVSYISWGTTGDIAVSEDYDGDNKADHAIYRPSTGQFWVRSSIDGGATISESMPGMPLVMDYDGDGRAEFATFDNGTWRITGSGPGSGFGLIVGFGMAGDKPVPGDYDGDGRDTPAVYRPSDGTWYILNSFNNLRVERWGIATDIPAPGDYDGDSKVDLAVYRDGIWYINQSTNGILITPFGLAGDKPLPAAYIP